MKWREISTDLGNKWKRQGELKRYISSIRKKIFSNISFKSIFEEPTISKASSNTSVFFGKSQTPSLYQFSGQKYASYKGSAASYRKSLSPNHVKIANASSLIILFFLTSMILLFPLIDLMRKRKALRSYQKAL